MWTVSHILPAHCLTIPPLLSQCVDRESHSTSLLFNNTTSSLTVCADCMTNNVTNQLEAKMKRFPSYKVFFQFINLNQNCPWIRGSMFCINHDFFLLHLSTCNSQAHWQIQPTWAPDKQAKMVLLKNSFLRRYSNFKVAVSRDFLAFFYFINRIHLGPWEARRGLQRKNWWRQNSAHAGLDFRKMSFADYAQY